MSGPDPSGAATTAGLPWGADSLAGLRVVDLSSDLAGAVCTKVVADAGATVTKVEDRRGDPLRRWSPTGAPPPAAGSALFRHLTRSKRSVVLEPDVAAERHRLDALLEGADLVVWSPGSSVAAAPDLQPQALAAAHPGAVVCAVTPFGLTGPWAGRPATDLTLQAWGGGVGHRGTPGGPPVMAGGRVGEWSAGILAAVSSLTALDRRRATGRGDLVDVSILETVMTVCAMGAQVAYRVIAGQPMRAVRMTNMPAIHRAADGWTGFMVLTGQQWLDFCVLVEHPEWMADEALLLMPNRVERADEIGGAIDEWTARHTVAEVLERAALLRVPAAAVVDGATVAALEQTVALGLVEADPSGDFSAPVPPYRFSVEPGRSERPPSPALGAHTAEPDSPVPPARAAAPTTPATAGVLSAKDLSQLRVADLTSFWAGTTPGRYLAMAGADVIRVESPVRLDGFRYATIRSFDDDLWWEWAPLVEGCNVGKRHLGLDLSSERGRDVLLRLLRHCDVLVENYTPRVLEHWGLTPEVLLEANPSLVVLRMPAFGLEGPWRDRPGFAQVMEMFTGMAWTTGFPDGPPMLPNGQVDPIGGYQAVLALLVGLEHRRRTGRGMLIESPLFAAALAVAAEPVVEHSASGATLSRLGNRHPTWAPQGVYRCADEPDQRNPERWVALSVTGDDQWAALQDALGRPGWADDPALDGEAGRRAAHDAIDAHLSAWTAGRRADDVVELLWDAGIPVARVLMPHETDGLAQVQTRGFYEELHHPITGTSPHATFPAVVASQAGRPRVPRPAPMLGQHNRDILGGLLGMSSDEIDALEQAGVVGTRPLPG